MAAKYGVREEDAGVGMVQFIFGVLTAYGALSEFLFQRFSDRPNK